jgi:PEP-CTERM motif
LRKIYGISAIALLVACCFLFASTPLRADTGSFGGGGFMSGTFVYNSGTNTFTSWDITTTASGGFAAQTYSNTIAGSVGGPGGFNGADFYDFQFFDPQNGGSTLFFTVPGVADSSISGLPAAGQTTQIQLVTLGSADAGAAECVGLGGTGSVQCSAEGNSGGYRYLATPTYFDVTDAPGIYTFTITSTPLSSGSGGNVPEPGTLALTLIGLAGAGLKKRFSTVA